MRLPALSALALMVPFVFSACGGDDDSSNAAGGHAGTAGKGGSNSGGKAGTTTGAGTGGSSARGGTGGSSTEAGASGNAGTGEAGRTSEAGSGGSGGTSGKGGTGGTTTEGGNAGEGGAAPVASSFKVRIENISAAASSPTPVSPGVWLVTSHTDPLFSVGTADRGQGLERIAEEGNNGPLAATLANDTTLAATGTWDTPLGASAAGPATPGNAYEFTVTAKPGDGTLSFATMFGQSNDTFFAPDGNGIALFASDGTPLPAHDVTSSISLWNAGTERDQAPGMGPDQAPREPAANVGPAEGTIAHFSDTTRALPIPSAIIDVTVTEIEGTFTLVVSNVSDTRHAIDTPISPVFFATHDATWSLFTPGAVAPDGLESLAEDGSPAALVTANTGVSGTGTVDAVTVADGASSAGPALTGGSFTFSVTPDIAHPFLSFGSMVGTTNDAFLALQPSGVALLDSTGALRAASDVQADIASLLAVWDAGTEANEVPGIGPNQAARQPAPNTGPADPDDQVRLYADSTNDFAGASIGGYVSVSVVHATGNDFQVTITDTANTTKFPGKVAPTAWAVHTAATQLFEDGGRASAGLERLAEDGDPSIFGTEIALVTGVGSSGIVDTAMGQATAGPLVPGQSFQFTVTADTTHRFLSIAGMLAPTNDTFMAFDPGGIALLDDTGAVRADEDIAADVTAHLFAWDAGTEANQAGAAGPDQVGRTPVNTGASEGNGMVRLQADPVWPYPAVTDLVKVTITPLP